MFQAPYIRMYCNIDTHRLASPKKYPMQGGVRDTEQTCPGHYCRIRINKPICCMRIKLIGKNKLQDILLIVDLNLQAF